MNDRQHVVVLRKNAPSIATAATFLMISIASFADDFSPLPTIRVTIRLTAELPPLST